MIDEDNVYDLVEKCVREICNKDYISAQVFLEFLSDGIKEMPEGFAEDFYFFFGKNIVQTLRNIIKNKETVDETHNQEIYNIELNRQKSVEMFDFWDEILG